MAIVYIASLFIFKTYSCIQIYTTYLKIGLGLIGRR